MRSFIIYLNFVSLLAVCLFACNHHSSNPMLQQVDSLLEMKPDSALTILKNISVLDISRLETNANSNLKIAHPQKVR